jgi:hypothetical protein
VKSPPCAQTKLISPFHFIVAEMVGVVMDQPISGIKKETINKDLEHEVLDDSVKNRALVSKTLLACRELKLQACCFESNGQNFTGG